VPERAPKNSQTIPSAQNFSPNEVRLPEILDLVHLHEGNRRALTEAIRLAFCSTRSVPKSGGTVWANVTSGMVQYGIIDEAPIHASTPIRTRSDGSLPGVRLF